MTLDLFWTFVAGGAVALAGACLGVKQMLSAPDRPNYPTAGPWARLIWFWLSALLIARGVEILVKALRPDAVPLTGFAVAASLLILAFFSNELYVHLTSRASARTQRLIHRIKGMARCAPRDDVLAARLSATESGLGDTQTVPNAVAALRGSGMRVVAPNEGPETIVGPWR